MAEYLSGRVGAECVAQKWLRMAALETVLENYFLAIEYEKVNLSISVS